MTETIQDLQIEDYLLNKHDYDIISKYTNEGVVSQALAQPIADVKSEIDFLTQSKGGKNPKTVRFKDELTAAKEFNTLDYSKTPKRSVFTFLVFYNSNIGMLPIFIP